jgi:hypothetical protein
MFRHRMRKLGETRTIKLSHHEFRKNLCSTLDISNKEVIFIGKHGETFCLTPKKKYKVINSIMADTSFDRVLQEKLREKYDNVHIGKYDQSEDYYLVLINDKGHKRRYNHQMFKLVGKKK